MTLKLFGYAIFYLFLTVFFIYIFTREKMLAEKMDAHRNKFADKLIAKYNIGWEKGFKTLLRYIETIVVAGVLVVVIQRFYIGNFVIPTGSMIPTIKVGDRIFANMVTYKFTNPERNDIIVFKEPIQNKDLYTKRAMGLPGETIKIQNKTLYINGEATDFRKYTNLGIEDQEWVVPKKGDKLEIIPAGDYNTAYKNANLNIAEVQKDLKSNSYLVENLMPNLKFYVNGKETGKILDFIHDEKILSELMKGNKVELSLSQDYFLVLGDNTEHSFDSRMWGFVAKDRIRGKALVRFWPLNRIGLISEVK